MNKNNYLSLIIIFILILTVAIPTIYAVEDDGNSTGQINDGDQNLTSIINKILELVNIERVNKNLTPLTLDMDLNFAAMIRSEEIVQLFEHLRPDGSEITTISSKIYGENIASGQPTAEIVMGCWTDSPHHMANILNPNFTTLGVGYTYIENDTSDYGSYYWVQLFGGVKETDLKTNTTGPTNNNTNNTNNISNNTSINNTNNNTKTVTKITLIQVGKLAIPSVSYNKITLKWNAQNVANANGYQIFRYNSKTKTYSLIKTLSGNKITTYTNTGLSSVTSYSYKVRSYLNVNGKTYYGPYSSVVKTTTKPTTPSLKLTAGKKKATIHWKKVSKAKGYQIYKSSSKNGKYTLKKTIKSGSTIKFTDTGLKKGKTYYYKIRSYSTVNKVNIYSSLSSPKAVKAK